MDLRNLGKTSIKITPIGLGVWQFAGGTSFHKYVWNNVVDDEKNQIVKSALDGGINWFDTAELYGKGKSEMALARGLEYSGKKDGDVVIATKWSPIFRTAKSIKKTIGDRIAKLTPFSIDLHQVHQPLSFSSVKAEMSAMADLIDEKIIKSTGISNFSGNKMREANDTLENRGYSLASNQVKYSLLDRKIEDNGVLEAAKDIGSTIIAYSPLGMGLLTGKYHDNPNFIKSKPIARRRLFKKELARTQPFIDELKVIAKEHLATPGQVALNWLINFHGDTVVAIPGASKSKHADESAKVMNFSLSKEQMNIIDELSVKKK